MPDTRRDLAVQTCLNLLINLLPSADNLQSRLKSWSHTANARPDNTKSISPSAIPPGERPFPSQMICGKLTPDVSTSQEKKQFYSQLPELVITCGWYQQSLGLTAGKVP